MIEALFPPLLKAENHQNFVKHLKKKKLRHMTFKFKFCYLKKQKKHSFYGKKSKKKLQKMQFKFTSNPIINFLHFFKNCYLQNFIFFLNKQKF